MLDAYKAGTKAIKAQTKDDLNIDYLDTTMAEVEEVSFSYYSLLLLSIFILWASVTFPYVLKKGNKKICLLFYNAWIYNIKVSNHVVYVHLNSIKLFYYNLKTD